MQKKLEGKAEREGGKEGKAEREGGKEELPEIPKKVGAGELSRVSGEVRKGVLAYEQSVSK